MVLTKIKNIGEYEHSITGQLVNMKQGRKKDTSSDHFFYLRRGERVFVLDAEFYKFWKPYPK